MRNLKVLSIVFLLTALFLTLSSYSFAAGIEAVGDNLTGSALNTDSAVNTSNTAVSSSDGAENTSVKKEDGAKGRHNRRSFGKRSVFGKVFGFFEGLFDKTVGFFKKVGSALGFKGCETSGKTAQANDDNSANGETAASNNTETATNDSSSVNTSQTATTTTAATGDVTNAAVSDSSNVNETVTGAVSDPTPAVVTQTSIPQVSSVNGGSVVTSTPQTSVVTSTATNTASNNDETQNAAVTNTTTATAVSSTEGNTQTQVAANNAEDTIQTVAASLGTGVTGTVPERQAGAETGSAFMARVQSISLTNYDKAVLDEITRGNIPEFLKKFKEVKVNFKTKDGAEHTASYFVMPDYLAIGTDADFVRVPMTPMAAQKIADMYGCQLPTKKMVDDIYSQATVKLNPQPISVDKGISKISNFMEHQKMVEKQRAGQPLGALTAGDKKDVVITNLLDQAAAAGKKQVAIYGWHQKNGKPIQPLSTIHNYYHVDYSHGIRLVKDTMTVDGKTVKVADALKDAELSKAISYEGTIKNTKAHR